MSSAPSSGRLQAWLRSQLACLCLRVRTRTVNRLLGSWYADTWNVHAPTAGMAAAGKGSKPDETDEEVYAQVNRGMPSGRSHGVARHHTDIPGSPLGGLLIPSRIRSGWAFGPDRARAGAYVPDVAPGHRTHLHPVDPWSSTRLSPSFHTHRIPTRTLPLVLRPLVLS